MKRVFLFFVTGLLILSTYGYAIGLKNKAETRASKDLIRIKIGWRFETSIEKDINGTDIPSTDISLMINGQKKEIMQCVGYPEEVKSFKEFGLPSNAILACRTWFGGTGVDIYVRTANNKKALEIMSREVEGSDDKLNEFTKVKSIQFNKRIHISTVKTVVIR